jgi:hypothetical protein
VISLAVAAAGWVGVSSPGDYAALEFPPPPRHDQMFGLDPFCGTVFVFRSKRADRIKLLVWE